MCCPINSGGLEGALPFLGSGASVGLIKKMSAPASGGWGCALLGEGGGRPRVCVFWGGAGAPPSKFQALEFLTIPRNYRRELKLFVKYERGGVAIRYFRIVTDVGFEKFVLPASDRASIQSKGFGVLKRRSYPVETQR